MKDKITAALECSRRLMLSRKVGYLSEIEQAYIVTIFETLTELNAAIAGAPGESELNKNMSGRCVVVDAGIPVTPDPNRA